MYEARSNARSKRGSAFKVAINQQPQSILNSQQPRSNGKIHVAEDKFDIDSLPSFEQSGAIYTLKCRRNKGRKTSAPRNREGGSDLQAYFVRLEGEATRPEQV